MKEICKKKDITGLARSTACQQGESVTLQPWFLVCLCLGFSPPRVDLGQRRKRCGDDNRVICAWTLYLFYPLFTSIFCSFSPSPCASPPRWSVLIPISGWLHQGWEKTIRGKFGGSGFHKNLLSPSPPTSPPSLFLQLMSSIQPSLVLSSSYILPIIERVLMSSSPQPPEFTHRLTQFTSVRLHSSGSTQTDPLRTIQLVA